MQEDGKVTFPVDTPLCADAFASCPFLSCLFFFVDVVFILSALLLFLLFFFFCPFEKEILESFLQEENRE